MRTLSILFLAFILVSCTPSFIDRPTSSSTPLDTAEILTSTNYQTTTPTPYSIPTGTLTSEPSLIPATARPDEQVFIDPQGWYSLNIPEEWQLGDLPGSFVGEDGFFETGYLPEMMYMDHRLNVCQWIANVDTKGTYAISAFWTTRNGCQLVSLPDISPNRMLEIVPNPSADFPQRYLYLIADADHFDQISATFTWLKPISESLLLDYQGADVRGEDLSFWDNTDPLPGSLSVREYKMPDEVQNENPGDKIFLEFIPPEAQPTKTDSKSESSYTPKTLESINSDLGQFGYELEPINQTGLYDLYQDGELALKNLYRLPDVHVNPTSKEKKLAFIAYTQKDPGKSFYAENNAVSYLVQNDSITLWKEKPVNPMYTAYPIWNKEELLILGLGDGTDVQLRDSDNELLFSFATYFGTHIPIKQFSLWEGHWILGIDDFLVIDGEILNEKYGFEEVYRWSLFEEKPFYFFRKGPRAGFSYDGMFFPIYYHEIAHGYCCGLALNNPWVFDESIRFFGKRDGVWYYVVVEIE